MGLKIDQFSKYLFVIFSLLVKQTFIYTFQAALASAQPLGSYHRFCEKSGPHREKSLSHHRIKEIIVRKSYMSFLGVPQSSFELLRVPQCSLAFLRVTQRVPQSSSEGILAFLALLSIAQNCLALLSIAQHCLALLSIAQHCSALLSIAQHWPRKGTTPQQEQGWNVDYNT